MTPLEKLLSYTFWVMIIMFVGCLVAVEVIKLKDRWRLHSLLKLELSQQEKALEEHIDKLIRKHLAENSKGNA